MDFITLHAK